MKFAFGAIAAVMFAAVVLSVLSLAGFVMGFKDTFSRPGREGSGRIPPPATSPSTPPLPAVALTDTTLPPPAVEPESSTAPASSAAPAKKPKPKPVEEDAAADQINSSTPTERTPASSAAPPSSAQPAPDAIGDLLPPH